MTAKLCGGKNVSEKHCRSRPGRLLSNSRNAKPGPVCEPFYLETLAANENPRVLTFSRLLAISAQTPIEPVKKRGCSTTLSLILEAMGVEFI
ncbi:hypothetical protein Hdeb2414_s0025g00666631 [Helianthus debilis subsp. tardiflorus]